MSTICALTSAAGKAGVSVIRLSGPDSIDILRKLTRKSLPSERYMAVRYLYAQSDTLDSDFLDDALVVFMRGPRSFTGEDIVELHVHGGNAIVSSVIDACLDTKLCRLAEPGEFTRRAFENGRIDLTRAEAIADLIDAETKAQHQQAIKQYDGAFYEQCMGWRQDILNALASLDAAIDFPDEEDVPVGIDSRAYPLIDSLLRSMRESLSVSSSRIAVRDGFKISIIGPPNAGKSTLLNYLAGREAAIVSEIPGTTRDIVEIRLEIKGYLVWVSDTAGIRETEEQIEAEGVKRAKQRADESDLRIFVCAPDAEPPEFSLLRSGDIILQNKCDLKDGSHVLDIAQEKVEIIEKVSLKTEQGLSSFISKLESRIVDEMSLASDAGGISRKRHKKLIENAVLNLERASNALMNGLTADLISEDIRLAARDIGRITGQIDSEHILDEIFGEFCIGK